MACFYFQECTACIDGLRDAGGLKYLWGSRCFQRILVPVDLTEKSLAAVDLAYEFATQSGAEVILLHVIETIEHVQFEELKPFYDRLEASARKGLQEFSERFVSHKLKVDDVLIYGHRTKEIVDYAIENGSALSQ